MTTDLDESPAAADAPSSATGRPEDRATVTFSRRELVGTAIVAVALVVAIAVAAGFLVTSPSEGGDEDAVGGGPAVVVRDAFDRRRPLALGRADTGQPWREVQGRWAVGPKGAEVRAPDGLLDSLAIVDLGATDGRVDVRFEEGLASGAGLVVRYVDPSNYVGLVPNLTLGAWQIVVVENARRTVVGEFSARIAVPDITVRLRGRSIDFSAGGRFGRTVTVDADADATGVGLLGGFSTAGIWTNFEARSEAALLDPGSATP